VSPKASSPARSLFRQPSAAIVLVAGGLTIVFLIAIGRELFQGHQVRTQVKRLRAEITAEETRQRQLQDLLTYLQSPTFQERQARLELGLQKSGERVIILPPGSSSDTVTEPADGSARSVPTAPTTNPGRWFDYFFSRS